MQVQDTLFISKPTNAFVSRETLAQYEIHYCHAGKNPLRVANVAMLVMAMRIRRLLLADERVNNRKWRDVDVKVWDNVQSRYIVS